MKDILVLDLGTTRTKTGRFSDGVLSDVRSLPSPPLSGENGMRVSNPKSWLKVAETLIGNYDGFQRLALATQRSSFLIWNRRTGNPVTPLICWQDLRAGEWTRFNHHLEDWTATGLPLSPHYAGPKLAMTLEDHDLRDQLDDLLFGTLDTWLIWNWTDGQRHVTGLSIAARTLLLNLDEDQWSQARLRSFGIPQSIMPQILDNPEDGVPVKQGFSIEAILADQAAGTIPLFQSYPNSAYVNTGTGVFVMRFGERLAPEGYQTARVGSTTLSPNTFLWEGAINGGVSLFLGPAFNFFKERGPNQFAVGDTAGLGAPFWREDLSGHLSKEARALPFEAQREIMAEALLFRIRQVIEGLFQREPPKQVLLAGGLAARSDFTQALATLLPMPLYIIQNREMGLWGAGWQASAMDGHPEIPLLLAPKARGGKELRERYEQWKVWIMETGSARRSPTGFIDRRKIT